MRECHVNNEYNKFYNELGFKERSLNPMKQVEIRFFLEVLVAELFKERISLLYSLTCFVYTFKYFDLYLHKIELDVY